MPRPANSSKIADLARAVRKLPAVWNGQQSILDLKAVHARWRDTEWMGFFFEYLCQKNLSGVMTIPGPQYTGPDGGKVKFDGAMEDRPWDFKAHCEMDRDGKSTPILIGNDLRVTTKAINEFGWCGLLVASGEAVFNDKDGSFKQWHDALKKEDAGGRLTPYQIANIQRNAWKRLRKTKFTLSKVLLLKLTLPTITRMQSFKQGRNSNGNPRREKYQINLDDIKPSEILAEVVFQTK